VKPFSQTDQMLFIAEYLGRYRKSLTAQQTRTLQGHPLSGNPLFLLTVLEELRVFGVHEELDQRLETLLSPPPSKGEGEAPTVDDVFEHVLARIEADLGEKVVQAAAEAIWASRGGLLREELLAVAQLTPAAWASLQNALDEGLYESRGRISFGHDYLRKAVEDRYDLTGERKLNVHRRLAHHFDGLPVDARVAEELPWQWEQAGERRKLKECLLDLNCFRHMGEAGVPWTTVYHWWQFADPGEQGRSYLELLMQAWQAPCQMQPDCLGEESIESELADAGHELVSFLLFSGWKNAATQAARWQCEELERRQWEHPATLRAVRDVAKVLTRFASDHKSADLCEAEAKLERVREVLLRKLGPKHKVTLALVVEIALCRCERRELRRALAEIDEAIAGLGEVHGPAHPETLQAKGIKAQIMRDIPGSWQEGGGEGFLRAVLADMEQGLGREHPDTLTVVRHLAKCVSYRNDYPAAEKLYRRTLEGRMKTLGATHLDTLKAMVNLANVRAKQGHWREVEGLCRAALAGLEPILGTSHWNTRRAANTLAAALMSTGQARLADPLLRSDYEFELELDPGSRACKSAAMWYASCLARLGRRSEAITLLRAECNGDEAGYVALALAEHECATGNPDEALRVVRSLLQRRPNLLALALDLPELLPIRGRIRALRAGLSGGA